MAGFGQHDRVRWQDSYLLNVGVLSDPLDFRVQEPGGVVATATGQIHGNIVGFP